MDRRAEHKRDKGMISHPNPDNNRRWFNGPKPEVVLFCCYCGEVCNLTITREHLIPKSKGGNSTRKNMKDCCFQCNQERGNKDWKHWATHINKHLLRNNLSPGQRRRLENILLNIQYLQEYIVAQGDSLYTGSYILRGEVRGKKII